MMPHMNYPGKLTPQQLGTDLRMLSSSIARELYLAIQKLAAYPPSHPTRREAVVWVFLLLKDWLKFKHCFQLETDGENLWTEHVILERDSFVKSLAHLFKRNQVRKVRFYDWVREDELHFFIDHVNSLREPLATRLCQQGITSIEVSSWLYGKRQPKAGMPKEDGNSFTVRELAKDELKRNPSIALEIVLDRFEKMEAKSAFRKEVLCAVTEEVFGCFSSDLICRLTREKLRGNISTRQFEGLMQQIDKHPQAKALRFDLGENLKGTEFDEGVHKLYFEGFASDVLENSLERMSSEDFRFSLSALLGRGKDDKLRSILDNLIGQLLKCDISSRRRSLNLIKSAADLLIDHAALFSYLNRTLLDSWRGQKGTFEILDVLCFLAEKLLVHQSYLDFGTILDYLKEKILEEPLAYRKEVLQKTLDRLTSSEVINTLIADMSRMEDGKAFEIARCLESINNNEVMEKLSRMLNHPQSIKRVICLRILARMGDQGIEPISRLFEEWGLSASAKKKSLDPENKIRIYEVAEALAGSRSQGAAKLLERILGVEDTQIKLKMISVLKNSDVPQVFSLLRVLAFDAQPQIRRKTIDALRGKVWHGDLEWLKALYFDDHRNLKELIDVIAELRSQEAEDFLASLLTVDKRLRREPAAQIRILEVLSKREGGPAREEVWRLKQRLNAGPTSSLRRLVLKRKVNQLIRQATE